MTTAAEFGSLSPASRSRPDAQAWPRAFANTAFFFCFFPSLIYFVMPSQTQPIAAALALPLLFLAPLRLTQLTLPFLLLAGLIVVYMFVTLAVYPEIAGAVIANAGSYLSPLVLFLAFRDKLHLLSPKPLFASIYVWCGVGAIQAFPFPGVIKSAMEWLGQHMLERFIAGQYTEQGGRGYSLLASEPSFSAPTVLFMGLAIYFFYREGKLTAEKSLWGLACVGFLVALNRSGSLGVLLLIVMAAAVVGLLLHVRPLKRVLIVIGSFVFVVAAGALLLQLEVGDGVRVVTVLQQLATLLSGQSSVDPMSMFVIMGDQRVINLMIGYKSVVTNYGLGHGIAAWDISSVLARASAATGVDPYDYFEYMSKEITEGGAQVKPSSYFSLIAFDMGFVGLIPLTWGVGAICFWRAKIIGPFGDNRLIYLLPAVVWLLVFGLSTLPMPWVLFAMSRHVLHCPPHKERIRIRIA